MRYSSFFLIIGFLASSFSLFGQKIDGVYYGEIVSPKNAMVLVNKGDQVKGIIYLNEKDTIIFFGTYYDHTFKSTIHLKDNLVVSVTGRLEKNAMWVNVSHETKERFLNKVSTKANYSIHKLFKPNLDPMLLGQWEFVKSVDIHGVTDASGKFALTYFDDHRMFAQVLSIPASFKRNDKISDAQLLSYKTESSWETDEDELIEEALSLRGYQPRHISKYSIKQDTLVTGLPNNSVAYSVYKKK